MSAARPSPPFLVPLLGSVTQGLLAPVARSPRAVPRPVADGIVHEYLTSQLVTIDGVGYVACIQIVSGHEWDVPGAPEASSTSQMCLKE